MRLFFAAWMYVWNLSISELESNSHMCLTFGRQVHICLSFCMDATIKNAVNTILVEMGGICEYVI